MNIRDQVLLFIADECEKSFSGKIESTGLADRAVLKGAVTKSDHFRPHLGFLRKDGLVDTTRSGKHAYLYWLTKAGHERVRGLRVHIDNQKQEDDNMSMKSIEDQLREKMGGFEQPQSNYTAPAGIPLPKAGQYTRDAQGLIDLFKDRINPRPEENDKHRLQEEFTKLTAEGRPAFDWIQEAIC